MNSFTTREIETWLASGPWRARTRRGYLLNLRTVLNFGARRGYLTVNPAAPIDLPKKPCAAPGIHTPAQVRTVLDCARRLDLILMRALAVRYFARLRASECNRIKWSCRWWREGKTAHGKALPRHFVCGGEWARAPCFSKAGLRCRAGFCVVSGGHEHAAAEDGEDGDAGDSANAVARVL